MQLDWNMYLAHLSILRVLVDITGLITLSRIVYIFVDFILFHFRTSADPLSAYRLESSSQHDTRQQRPYALITGSSGGIGLGLAESLIARGFGVILLSNDAAGLATAKDTLKSRHLESERCIETIEMDVITATGNSYFSWLPSARTDAR